MSNMNVVAHNLLGMNANRQLGIVTEKKKKSTEKLSSGYRINRSADDAAGLAISEKMRRQINGLTQGTENTHDGISMCQIADGALSEVSDMMHRITELSVQSANDTNNSEDRQAIQQEVNALLREIDRISDTTTFNEKKIFKDNSVKDEDAELTPYDKAKADLINASYKTVSSDVTLSDGQTISKDDANAIISLLSNTAITGSAYEVYKEYARNYDYAYKYTMDEVKDYVLKNRGKIANNTHSLYEYGDSELYLNKMMTIERMVSDVVDEYKNTGNYRINIMDSVMDNYASAMNMSRTGVNSTGHWIANGLFYTDSLTFNSYRTSNIPYENQIGYATGSFVQSAKEILEKNGINSGNLYERINNSLTIASWGWRTKEGNSGVDMATRAYMEIIGLESTTKEEDDHNKFWIQSGAEAGDGIYINFGSMDTTVLGIEALDISTESGAQDALSTIKQGLRTLSSIRSDIGAQQNRLEHTIRHQENTIENTQAAESKIRDTDMATEMMAYSSANIIQQAGQSMLSQANQSNKNVLSLLG